MPPPYPISNKIEASKTLKDDGIAQICRNVVRFVPLDINL